MAFCEWVDGYSVNVAEIDRQHQQMVQGVNRLFQAMATRSGREVLTTAIAELIECTRDHFATEERLMGEHGYPGLAEHAREHAQLVAELLEYNRHFVEGDTLLSFALALRLKGWALRHIVSSDRELGHFLNQHGQF
jgi:hemerythrin